MGQNSPEESLSLTGLIPEKRGVVVVVITSLELGYRAMKMKISGKQEEALLVSGRGWCGMKSECLSLINIVKTFTESFFVGLR